MKKEDREQMLRFLEEGASVLEETAAAITGQLARHAPSGRWTPLEILEHIAITEPLMLAMVAAGKADSTRPDSDPAKDHVMITRVIARERRVQAPQTAEPTGRFASIEEALAAFRSARAATLEFVKTCDRDLRAEHTTHPVVGLMPSYNCLLLLASHPPRHAAQIRELLALE